MIDSYILPTQKRFLQPLANLLVRSRVSADNITVVGFLVGLAAAPLLAFGHYGAALAVILINRIFDGLDGVVARTSGPTDRGAYIDIAFDFFFYATIPFGFALANPEQNALAASALVAAFMGTGSSFLAFATIAAKRGISADAYPQKGIYYLGGLAEGAETIAAFAAMCIWPDHFAAIAWSYAAICMVTTVTRWRQGWVVFSEKEPEKNVRNAAGTRPTREDQNSLREPS